MEVINLGDKVTFKLDKRMVSGKVVSKTESYLLVQCKNYRECILIADINCGRAILIDKKVKRCQK